jgi:hypothetical protein
MFKTMFAIFVAVLFSGCAAVSSYDVGRNAAVPVQELGARGAEFAGQAQQFHQANMAIDLCPQGTAEKEGGGSVNSGAGDKNGIVTYNVTTQSVAKSKCDFGPMNKPAAQPKSAPVEKSTREKVVPAEKRTPAKRLNGDKPVGAQQ